MQMSLKGHSFMTAEISLSVSGAIKSSRCTYDHVFMILKKKANTVNADSPYMRFMEAIVLCLHNKPKTAAFYNMGKAFFPCTHSLGLFVYEFKETVIFARPYVCIHSITLKYPTDLTYFDTQG